MSWNLDHPPIKDATVGSAHALLLQSSVPEPIRMYVRAGIAGLVTMYGDNVLVTVSGYGHLCERQGDHELTTAVIEVKRGADALMTDGPTIAEWVDSGYRANQYPPSGYAPNSTPDEIAAAIKFELLLDTQAAADAQKAADAKAQESAAATQAAAEAAAKAAAAEAAKAAAATPPTPPTPPTPAPAPAAPPTVAAPT